MRTATQTTRNSEPSPVQEEVSEQEGVSENVEVILQDIASLALEGRVPYVPFAAGEADQQVVHQQWGSLSK